MSAHEQAMDMLERVGEVLAEYGAAEDDAVRYHLAQELALLRGNGPSRLAYEGPQGFVLSHGLDWESPPRLPAGFEWMEARNCYGNAAELALTDRRLTYCEGYAMGRFFPIPHAWVVDRRGVVIDPTWRPWDDETEEPPRETWRYVGVPFTTRFLVEQLTRNETYGLIDQWESGYRLLKRPLARRAVPERYRGRVFR